MLKIIHTTTDFTVIFKPAGLLSEGEAADSVPTALREALTDRGITPEGIYTVHRLDLNVGGVMVFARTKEAAAALCREVSERSIQKEYLAAVSGTPAPAAGELRDWLYHDARANKTFVVKKQRKGVKEAVQEKGFLGVLTGGLKATAGGITAAIICGLLVSLIFKDKDKS